jgi:hypothetical protein
MAERQIDPARLEGEDLKRWYLRSPAEVEADRQAAQSLRYRDFFDSTPIDERQDHEASPIRQTPPLSDDVLWIANGGGGYRAIRSGSNDFGAALQSDQPANYPDYLPDAAAALEDGEFLDIGNPHNRRLRREWEQREGRPWPRTEDNRRYHVAHGKAVADGGTNTLDNIAPMHPDDHIAKHVNDGDYGRWARRPWIARTFGGKVEPPRGGPKALGLGGLLNPFNLLGIASGRIRSDSFSNFASDMVGVASPHDVARQKDADRMRIERQLIPDCPPGMQCI